MAFVDLEKAFDWVPREVVWWALRKLKVDGWIVVVLKSMYDNVMTEVKIIGKLSKAFEVRVHQSSVLSPLLFIIMLEAVSSDFRKGLPMELLHADDLVLRQHEADIAKCEKMESWYGSERTQGQLK